MLGCMISESYYCKFPEKKAILLLWVLFSISILLVFPLSLDNSLGFSFLAHAGVAIFGVSQALLIVVEIGYLTSYMKSSPETYALSLLLSLNEIPGTIPTLLEIIPLTWVFVIFIGMMIACIGITMRLTGMPKRFVTNNSSRNIILPFSTFAVEYYVVGVMII